MRRIDEILNRLTEIRNMMAAPDYDEAQSEALLDEVRKLNQEKAEIEARAAQTAELRRQVGAGTVAQIQRQEQEARGAAGAAADENPADSPVYRRAWLKNLAVRSGVIRSSRRARHTGHSSQPSLTTSILPYFP